MADLANENVVAVGQFGLRRRHQARHFHPQEEQEQENHEDDSNSILADDDEEEEDDDNDVREDNNDDHDDDDDSTNSQNGSQQQQQQQQPQPAVQGWIQRIVFPQRHHDHENHPQQQEGPRWGGQWRRRTIPVTLPARRTPNNNHNNNNRNLLVDDSNITIRASRAYCLFSTIVAILAIVAATPPPKLSLLWTTRQQQPPSQLLLSTVEISSFEQSTKDVVGRWKNSISDSNSNPSQGSNTFVNKLSSSSSSNDRSTLFSTLDGDERSDESAFVLSKDWWQTIQQLWNAQTVILSTSEDDQQQQHEMGRNDKLSTSTSQSTTIQQTGDDTTAALKNPAWWTRLFFLKPSSSSDDNDDGGTNDIQKQDSIRNSKKKQLHLKDSERGSVHHHHNNNEHGTTVPLSSSQRHNDNNYQQLIQSFLRRYRQYMNSWIDPVLLRPTAHTPTDIIDKILTSTPRLLAIANFLLAMTYLLHSAVAAWFLGPEQQQQESVQVPLLVDWANGTARIPPNVGGGIRQQHPHTAATTAAALNAAAASSTGGGARERMGGFLIFKLLLISAVVAPDTLDLLILLTWYTTLSCLRSLDHLAHATTTHLAALGQPPRPGAVQLLFLVLICDIVAASSCVALFHAAGWGMVILLTCDCALLAADVMRHILKHFQCTLEDAHTTTIQDLERQQLNLHNHHTTHAGGFLPTTTIVHQNSGNRTSNSGEVHGGQQQTRTNSSTMHGWQARNSNVGTDRQQQQPPSPEGIDVPPNNNMTPIEIQQESRRLDREMEVIELGHARRLSILDSVMFTLELLCHCFTVAHFCHIWTLHGVQFTLIDGVLALHLHSAISTVCKKIAQRRNVHSIARDLQGHFPNASDEELRKASAAGDVCCICLGTMSTGGHVKKLRCGHLYHTHCLREVVERAHSIHAAKCPLCRASLIHGPNHHPEESRGLDQQRRNNVVAAPTPAPVAQQQQEQVGAAAEAVGDGRPVGAGERALFRVSTEGILPTWLPIPAFSFEVVRRSPLGGAGGILDGGAQQQIQFITQQQPPLPQENGLMIAPLPQNDIPQMDGGGQQDALFGVNGNGDSSTVQDNPIPPSPIPPQQEQLPQQQPDTPTTSFLRRLLVLAGAIPMSPQEEARALTQLVDMFPQYDRSDLLRELQERGSAEGVAEAILMGIFSGVHRGD